AGRLPEDEVRVPVAGRDGPRGVVVGRGVDDRILEVGTRSHREHVQQPEEERDREEEEERATAERGGAVGRARPPVPAGGHSARRPGAKMKENGNPRAAIIRPAAARHPLELRSLSTMATVTRMKRRGVSGKRGVRYEGRSIRPARCFPRYAKRPATVTP